VPPVLSSQHLLVIAIGVTLCLGLLHLSYARRRPDPQRWVALWALFATLYQAARWVQLAASEPGVAVAAARVYTAASPLLIASLVAYGCALGGRRVSRGRALGFAGANLALALAALATPWLVTGGSYTAHDLFGRPYHGASFGPALLVLAAYIVAALGWLGRELRPSRELTRGERRVLLGCLAAYGALGLSSAASALELWAYPGLAEYGPVVMALGLSALQIHRRRRLEGGLASLVEARTAELAASEARYRELMENAPVGVFTCDAAGRLTLANARLLAIAGAPSLEAALGGNLLEAPRAVESGLAASLRRCLEGGETVHTEHRAVSHWGKSVDLRLVAAPLYDAAGVQQGALGLVEDVSERRELEERLRRSQKLEAVGELAVGIARQIDEPMALARANLAALREQWDALRKALLARAGGAGLAGRLAECEALIEESIEGIQRTIAIAGDMREFASGSRQRRGIDLNVLVAEAVRSVGHELRGEVRLEERYGALPLVMGAAGQLRQVFVNLIVNALQAVGEAGRVEVETAVEGRRALVRVRDDGVGIAPEHRDRLFDPFFTTKPAGEGTGLGLYVSHEIVRAHGGEIAIVSAPGRGACFEVRLPL
jgi:PAS domain S-box-containing protein